MCIVHYFLYAAEENRIYKAGGWVEFNRVNGNLALSRAIGDFNFKSNLRLRPEEQIITGKSGEKCVPIRAYMQCIPSGACCQEYIPRSRCVYL